VHGPLWRQLSILNLVRYANLKGVRSGLLAQNNFRIASGFLANPFGTAEHEVTPGTKFYCVSRREALRRSVSRSSCLLEASSLKCSLEKTGGGWSKLSSSQKISNAFHKICNPVWFGQDGIDSDG